MLLFYLVLLLSIASSSASRNVAELPNCADKAHKQAWILVNTLDGKLTALDYNDNGEEIWSVDTGPGPMLSSNIDRLELSNNGHWVRIIPSLTGILYKFNGDTIDAIPVTADNLLTASFKYLDDLVIAGGKEVRTYGVVMNSGQMLYECAIDGCKNKTDHDNFEDLLLLERTTKTVRAVEPRSGLEKWNFSVGQLNIKFPESSSCHGSLDQNLKFNMKAVVPEGLVYAFSEINTILWKKQFSAPIVNVWTWDGRNAKSVDLFSNTQYSWSSSDISPALYIGMHNKQLYIHESVMLHKYLVSNKQQDKKQITEAGSVSRIPWQPYPAKSSSLAVINVDKPKEVEETETETETTALSVLYASEYVNGNGFYLYTSDDIDKQNSVQCDNNITIEETHDNEDINLENEDDTPVQVIIVSLWYWWKEVTVIAITTAFAFNVIINKHLFARIKFGSESTSGFVDETPTNSKDLNIPLYIKSHSESSDKEFVSRYLTDFDPLLCLGRGGFGVVFEARNKIDECSYAVKRITLPNKPESRERVMREVRALAKLDHRNIVRYFNAWMESPPPEWIDDFDKVWNQDTLTEGLEFSKTTKTHQKVVSSVVIDLTQSQSNLYSTSDLNLKQPEINSSGSFIVFENSSGYQKSITASDDNEDTESSTNNTSNNCFIKCSDSKSRNSRSNTAFYAPGKLFLYIQMQLCQRNSLRDWLKDNLKRNTTEIVQIFDQIVSAVEYVHLKGLIHRDLKPSNIFFSMDGEVKIGDFGLVIFMEESSDDKDSVEKNSDNMQKHTQAVGTQLYMSPEQLNGLKYNYKVDIYSLGVILFELLVPFHTAMERIKTLSELRKNKFPDTFRQHKENEYQLLKLMLSESPEERPTTYGIRARPPFGNSTTNCDYHFELPPRQ